jgi:hypothetical protein
LGSLFPRVTRACFYEPLVNRTYADMASHYGTAVIPARPYKPRDKAKVEVGVQVVQRWDSGAITQSALRVAEAAAGPQHGDFARADLASGCHINPDAVPVARVGRFRELTGTLRHDSRQTTPKVN